jgi:hypothetical protein
MADRVFGHCATNANSCIERFLRTLKEQLLWVRHFENLKVLPQALHAFRDRYMSIVSILSKKSGAVHRRSCPPSYEQVIGRNFGRTSESSRGVDKSENLMRSRPREAKTQSHEQ